MFGNEVSDLSSNEQGNKAASSSKEEKPDSGARRSATPDKEQSHSVGKHFGKASS